MRFPRNKSDLKDLVEKKTMESHPETEYLDVIVHRLSFWIPRCSCEFVRLSIRGGECFFTQIHKEPSRNSTCDASDYEHSHTS